MNNTYMSGLWDMIEQRFASSDDRLKTSEWLKKNTTIKGRPFNWDKYPFQEALMDDESQNACTIKPSQVGVSEVYQRVILSLLRRNPFRKGIYAYPDDEMRKKNVQTRVHPMVDERDGPFILPTEDKPILSIELIQLGSSFLYMTGSKTGDATSTDADIVFLDEYDLHNMANASLFMSRMQNSDWRLHRKFSTPTWTNYGIHGAYLNSDQTEYMIKCDSCNHWQYPLFTPEFIHLPGLPSDIEHLWEIDLAQAEYFNMKTEESYVCCSRCRSKLDLGRSDNRCWVTKHPHRTHLMRGWRISPFSASTRPPSVLFRELHTTYQPAMNIKGFKNSALGEPEDAGKNRLDEAEIRACLGSREVPEIDANRATWIGIDIGHTCHVLIGQGESLESVKGVRAMQVPRGRLLDEVDSILKTYNVIGGTCDRHPESQLAEDLRVLSGGRIIPVEYRGQKEINLVKSPESDEVTHAQVNRTYIIDLAARMIRKKQIQFNGFENLDTQIIAQYRNMIRDEGPEKEATWLKLDQNDHFFHAGAFLAAALRLSEYQQAVGGHTGTAIIVAGVNVNGYTRPLTGNAPSKGSNIWQPLQAFSRH